MKALSAAKALKSVKGFIEVLHPGGDDRVVFSRKVGENWMQDIASVRTGDVGYWLPELWKLMTEDSYVTINSLHPAKGKNKRFPGLAVGVRHEGLLNRLAACWCDIDCHKFGRDPLSLKFTIEGLQELKKIPPVTLFHFSGNGLWLYWALKDDPFTIEPPKAIHQNRLAWKQIQQQIEREFRFEGSDPSHLLKMARIPGSVNTSAEKIVTYQLQFDAEGSPFRYTLRELADWFDVELAPSWTSQTQIQTTIPEGSTNPKVDYSSPARKRGWVALYESRLQDLQLLLQMRGGGFQKGIREKGAVILKTVLIKTNHSSIQIKEKLVGYARECTPAFSMTEIEEVMKQQKLLRFRDQTISDWLGITPTEAEQLHRFPPASQYTPGQRLLPTPKRKEKVGIFGIRENRRQAIKDIVAEMGRVPPVREMASILKDRGFEGNKDSCRKDYRFLKLETSRQRRMRLRKETSHPRLFQIDGDVEKQGIN